MQITPRCLKSLPLDSGGYGLFLLSFGVFVK
jgi:hypothetical protein